MANEGDKTIRDFGRQWTVFDRTEGYGGSVELLADYIAPARIDELKGRRVADIGADNGRFSFALIEAGAEEVIAVEPSEAARVIELKLREIPGLPLTVLNIAGDQLPPSGDIDVIISLGVIHHIPVPEPVIAAAFHALKPGGKLIIWLYGYEGNETYLAFAEPLRSLTKKLPHPMLNALSWLLNVPLTLYLWLCRLFPTLPLPMRRYMIDVIGRQKAKDRTVTIYDQLNPHFAKYYKREEALTLMQTMPFEVVLHHRHGYGWTVIGTKPFASTAGDSDMGRSGQP